MATDVTKRNGDFNWPSEESFDPTKVLNLVPWTEQAWFPWVVGVFSAAIFLICLVVVCSCLCHRIGRKFPSISCPTLDNIELRRRTDCALTSSDPLVAPDDTASLTPNKASTKWLINQSNFDDDYALPLSVAAIPTGRASSHSNSSATPIHALAAVGLVGQSGDSSAIPDPATVEMVVCPREVSARGGSFPVPTPTSAAGLREMHSGWCDSPPQASVCVVSHPQLPHPRGTKGLLKSRRGSHTSLTLSLSPSLDSEVGGGGTCGIQSLSLAGDGGDVSTNVNSSAGGINSGGGWLGGSAAAAAIYHDRLHLDDLARASQPLTREQLKSKLGDNAAALFKEFWEIPMNHASKRDVPVLGIGNKNRYQTIIPNESTRVVLKQIGNDLMSTYINANYIRGYNGRERAFIATQGPMSHTVDDFWRMIWETESPVIVMITNLVEKNKRKCEFYLPIGASQTFGTIQVTVIACDEMDGYTVRRIVLKHVTSQEERTCQHFWYIFWPDHTTPATARQLLRLVSDSQTIAAASWCHQDNEEDGDEEEESSINGGGGGPLVVHCSAGLGRTGCFIALSIGCEQLEREGCVDVLGLVSRMRLDRGGLVQTHEQYEFIHRALVAIDDDPVYDGGNMNTDSDYGCQDNVTHIAAVGNTSSTTSGDGGFGSFLTVDTGSGSKLTSGSKKPQSLQLQLLRPNVAAMASTPSYLFSTPTHFFSAPTTPPDSPSIVAEPSSNTVPSFRFSSDP